MKISKILEKQWDGYSKFHQYHLNLWIHIFTVPVFILGTFLTMKSIFNFDILSLIYSILLMAGAMGIQGFGHKKEEFPLEPFTSVVNAFIRIFLEQLYTFPKFVVSGKLYTVLKQ